MSEAGGRGVTNSSNTVYLGADSSIKLSLDKNLFIKTSPNFILMSINCVKKRFDQDKSVICQILSETS